MNDNEKAATFIGWKPEQVCDVDNYETTGDRAYCPRCHNFIETVSATVGDFARSIRILCHHSVPAPDMNDPRNYMKALEACHGYRMIKEDAMTEVRAFKFIDSEYKQGWGKTPVETLAALYDAEHPEGVLK